MLKIELVWVCSSMSFWIGKDVSKVGEFLIGQNEVQSIFKDFEILCHRFYAVIFTFIEKVDFRQHTQIFSVLLQMITSIEIIMYWPKVLCIFQLFWLAQPLTQYIEVFFNKGPLISITGVEIEENWQGKILELSATISLLYEKRILFHNFPSF